MRLVARIASGPGPASEPVLHCCREPLLGQPLSVLQPVVERDGEVRARRVRRTRSQGRDAGGRALDASKPELVERFTKRTFTAMIKGVGGSAINAGMVGPHVFERGVRDLYRTTGPSGSLIAHAEPQPGSGFANKPMRDREVPN